MAGENFDEFRTMLRNHRSSNHELILVYENTLWLVLNSPMFILPNAIDLAIPLPKLLLYDT